MSDPETSTRPADAPDYAHADVGLVCALSRELAWFLDGCEKVRKYTGGKFTFRGGRLSVMRVAVVEAGMGFANARKATQALIDAHTPTWLISTGYAGALVPEMKVGDIVLADALCDTHGQELTIDFQMTAEKQRRLHKGRIVTADHLVRLVEEKRELAKRYHALAVDMESLAVAQVAKETGTRFLAVRVISDDLSADLPPEILSVMGESGSFRVGAALGAVWNRFSSVKDMWRLREQTAEASRQLARFLTNFLPQLHEAAR